MQESNRQSERLARRLIEAGWPGLGRAVEDEAPDSTALLAELADLRHQLDRVRASCGALAERLAAEERRGELRTSCPRFDLRPVAAKVFASGRQFFGASRAAIVVRDELGEWECLAAQGLSAEFLDAVLAAPEAAPPIASALALEEPAFAADLPDLARESPLGRSIERERLASALALPLVVDRTVVGCLVYFHDRPRRYTPAEIELASALARYLATTIDDARRYLDADLLRLGSE